MARKVKLVLFLIIIFLAGVFMGRTVFADPGGIPWGCGYFDGACGYSGGFNRVLPNGVTATSDKNTFISDIEWYLNNGSYREQSGAAFIIQTMRGNVNRARPPSGGEIQNWKDRIYDGNVSLSVEDYSYDWNSGWHGGPQDDFFYPESDTRQSIVFRHNGNIVYVLKIDCGNVVGDFPGLPDAPPPPPPPPSTGHVQGRIFRDDNNDGVKQGAEPFVGTCGSGVLNVDASVTAGGNTRNADLCSPPSDPLYKIAVSPGTYTVTLNVPPGYIANINGTQRNNVSVTAGNDTDVGPWFGIRRPPVTIRGRVFDWKTQIPGGGYSGVQIETCGAGTVSTNGSGFFSFERPQGEGFCVRVVGGGPSNSAGPYLRPWNEGYGAQSPACPGFDGNPLLPLVDHGGIIGLRNFCRQATYECQMAGVHQQNPFPGCSFSDRNWNEGYDIVYVPDGSPSLSLAPNCPARTVRINASDPDGSPVPVRYRIDGGGWTTVMVSGSYDINMPNILNYDYDNHNVDAETNGVGPLGLPGFINRTASARYGNSASPTRACRDRNFTATPQAGPVNLLPDEETAIDVRFASNIDGTITPPGGPTQIKGVFYDRRFFIRRGASIINLTSPAPSAPDPRNADVPFSSPMIDQGTINPVTQTGDLVCQTVTIRPTAGTIDTVGNIVSDNGVTQESPEACERVIAKPYFRVYNSDVSAGFIVCPGWTSSISNGTIIAYNNDTGKGSGTQLAAFAINQINGFTSATGRTTAPVPPKGLTFSNVGGGPYGSGFGSGFCAHDYFGTRPGGLSVPPGGSNVDLGATPSGDYEYAGNLQVGGNLASGKKVTLYVDGDVFISSDILYSGPWATVNDIPNFSLVVKGNIYIAHTVSNIDGLFVAQPNGGSGSQIYTCAFTAGPTTFVAPTSAQLATDCNANQLTVNGAFIASRVRLLRTKGSMKDSSNGEPRTSGTIAERFIFSPEAWLSSSINPGSGVEPYEAITSVSPVL